MNSMLLTEGWDCPCVNCIIVLRPTKSRALYSQMVGRGTRICEGKKDLLLLDFLWHSSRHSLCRPAHLVCKSEEEAKTMTEELLKSTDKAEDILTSAKKARDIVKEREAALARELLTSPVKRSETSALGTVPKAKAPTVHTSEPPRHRKLVDPKEYAKFINYPALIYYPTAAGKSAKPPSEKQLALIESFGIDAHKVVDRKYAAILIETLLRRKREKLATVNQLRILFKNGFLNARFWSKDRAGSMISDIADNGWKVPDGIDPLTY